MRLRNDRGLGRAHPLILSGLLAVAVAACGGSAAATQAPSATQAAGQPSTAPADAGQPSAVPSDGPSTTTLEVGKEAWFAGFHVTLGTATAELKPGKHGTVTIEAKFENTGYDEGRFDGLITLESAGEAAIESLEQDIPSVAGETTRKGMFAFRVEDTFNFDDAVLTFGRPTNQQAVIPLKGGDVVSLEPVTLAVSGSAKAGDLRIDLVGAVVRADTPWNHGQQKKGSLIVDFDYSATFESSFAGGFAFTAENVALRLPDGSTVAVSDGSRSQSIELIKSNSTKKDLFSRFEIEDPAAGDYVFLVRDGDATGEIPFKVG